MSTTIDNNAALVEAIGRFKNNLTTDPKSRRATGIRVAAAKQIDDLVGLYMAANLLPQCFSYAKQHLEWFLTHDHSYQVKVRLARSMNLLLALYRRVRIEVGRAANGFHNGHAEWCGWLRHHNIEVTTEFDEKTGEMVTYATPFMAKAITGMQIHDPARFGNCPAIKKNLKIIRSQETAYDKAFTAAFYALGATWDEKVTLNDAYMAGTPINGISP